MSKDGLWRIIRSALQLVAGGGLGALVTQIVADTPDQYDPYIFLLSAGLTALAQIIIEEWRGKKLIGPDVVSKDEANDRIRDAALQQPGDTPPLIR